MKNKTFDEDKRESSYWTFGLVNNRLAEVFIEKGKITGFCYVKKEDYKTKKEQKWIENDITKLVVSYRKGKFRDKLTGKEIKQGKM